MSFIYITGAAGTGKSIIQHELQSRGVDAYDEDDPAIGAAHNKQTGQPVSVPPVEERTPVWFSHHEWRVLDSVLDELRTRAKGHMVILCGNSLSKERLDEVVDKVIYLRLDEDTLRERIAGRTDNDYGKSEHELQSILERKQAMDQRFDTADHTIVDATQPIDKVVSDILTAAGSTTAP